MRRWGQVDDDGLKKVTTVHTTRDPTSYSSVGKGQEERSFWVKVLYPPPPSTDEGPKGSWAETRHAGPF